MIPLFATSHARHGQSRFDAQNAPQRKARAVLGVNALAAAMLLFTTAPITGCKQTASQSSEATGEAASVSSALTLETSENAAPDSIVVYYFHGNRRCRTCMGIQSAITTTIDERFAAETASGALRFQEVNIDQPENSHFVKEFDLGSSSMVVVAKKGEKTIKWENCAQVWPLSHQQAALIDYAEKQIRSYLELVRST